ncbi:PAAR-like domain-containing protein [Pseudomonas kilonensis]|uniref:GHH signature containing HNH/Endo VII superfamily nuclease toxin 2 n=1 Tax=Pseudomonas kilonensis TaxID=132476 RepID=A0ABY0ZGZ8_9PSED|nr:PAAR-like domain-containing protein [Pseudomonas kilonensis]SEE66059.1 GHH signature containing HNH/Endo VII superfamily nuclease toxin 2 [Pseudomonas kilonensis]
MANQVFANNMEISCKAADGKSIACFPDVCFTPPQAPPTPLGVPIPYPNTGMAKDTAKGSRTVKITRKEVMLKDRSHFKTSYGDEAGCAPKKGVITGKIKGKVYFTSWSMDVKFEGLNVVRNMDLTTHNHASLPGNTPTWPYLDEAAFADDSDHACAPLAKKLKTHCEKHVKRTKKGQVKRKSSKDAMCADRKCKAAMKCSLSPYSPSNCCDGKTPHHVIPKHCIQKPNQGNSSNPDVYTGCEGYNSKLAPCVCVSGHDKSTGQHKKVHDIFDKAEDKNLVNGKAGTWTYEAAANSGATAVRQVLRCNPKCTRSQLDAYHQQPNRSAVPPKSPNISNTTNLRADSSGNRTPENFSTVASGTFG